MQCVLWLSGEPPDDLPTVSSPFSPLLDNSDCFVEFYRSPLLYYLFFPLSFPACLYFLRPLCPTMVFKIWQSKFFTSISITWWGQREMASWYRTSFKKLVVLCSPKPFTALFECWLHLMDVRSLKTMYNWDKHRHYTALSINVWQNCFESCFHNYTPEVTSWTSWCLAAAHKRETVGSST